MRHYFLLLLVPLIFVVACVNPPEYPVEPVIEFVGVNKDLIRALDRGNPASDSVEIQISFTDGDGDLSGLQEDSIDIFLQDSRFNLPIPFTIPSIPREGTGNGISGNIFITITNSVGICCFANREVFCGRAAPIDTDTLSYTIQIRDRAGNLSNEVRTTPITIQCN